MNPGHRWRSKVASDHRGRGSLFHLPGEMKRVVDAFHAWNRDPDITCDNNGNMTLRYLDLYEVWGKLTPFDVTVYSSHVELVHEQVPPLSSEQVWRTGLFEPVQKWLPRRKREPAPPTFDTVEEARGWLDQP